MARFPNHRLVVCVWDGFHRSRTDAEWKEGKKKRDVDRIVVELYIVVASRIIIHLKNLTCSAEITCC